MCDTNLDTESDNFQDGFNTKHAGESHIDVSHRFLVIIVLLVILYDGSSMLLLICSNNMIIRDLSEMILWKEYGRQFVNVESDFGIHFCMYMKMEMIVNELLRSNSDGLVAR